MQFTDRAISLIVNSGAQAGMHPPKAKSLAAEHLLLKFDAALRMPIVLFPSGVQCVKYGYSRYVIVRYNQRHILVAPYGVLSSLLSADANGNSWLAGQSS